MKEDKERMCFSFPKELREILKELAKADKRNPTNYLKMILNLEIDKIKERGKWKLLDKQ